MNAISRALPLLALSSGWEDATVTDVVAIVGVEVLTAVAFFLAGATAGSFLNVVLHRLPLRRNVLWPPSSCSSCGHRLALRDNVPVLGWLMLRGRCRHCGVAIPAGYPGVEAAAGLVALSLLYLVVHTGGATLPLRTPNHYGGALWTIWFPQPAILAIYAYFAALAFFLAGLTLFAWQDERLPGGFVAAALLVGVLVPLWQHVQQVPWGGRAGMGEPLGGVTEAAGGLAAGGLLGLAMGRTRPARGAHAGAPGPRWAVPPALDLCVVLGLIGAWLGWQAAVSVTLLTGLGLALVPARVPCVAVAAGAAAVQLLSWRALTQYAPLWPGPHTPPALMAGWALLAVAASRGRAAPRGRANTPAEPPLQPEPAGQAAPAAESRVGP